MAGLGVDPNRHVMAVEEGKFAPVIVTGVAPAIDPEAGITDSIVGEGVYMNEREREEKSTPLFDTVTTAAEMLLDAGGVAQTIEEEDANVAGTSTLLKRHSKDFEKTKLAPEIVIDVAPEEGPEVGDREYRMSSSVNVYSTEDDE